MSSELFDPIRTQAEITREVIVLFSTGKDSCVVFDLCAKFFDRCVPVFLYNTPGLSFQEKSLRFYEKKYGEEVIRLPLPYVSNYMRYGTYRPPDLDVPIVSDAELYNYIRNQTGIYWISGGERIKDSTVRRAFLMRSGSIDATSGRFYPVIYWSKRQILEYMRVKKLYLGQDSKILGTSYHGLMGDTLRKVRDNWPSDYEKIKRLYPLCDAAVRREEIYGSNKVSAV